METTTIGAVAESQQRLQTQQVEVPATTQAETQQVETNPTGTSSGTGEQSIPTNPETVAPQQEQPAEPTGPTLEEIAREEEAKKQKEENEKLLQDLINDTVRDLPPQTDEGADEATTTYDEKKSELESEQLKQQVDEIKTLKDAETVAKKLYLAYEKERRQRALDSQVAADTIDDLKKLIKQLNAKASSMDNDPRVVKLDDESYALYRLRNAYKADQTAESKKNLSRFYLTEVAIMNPHISANQLIDFLNSKTNSSNNIGANNGTVATVEEPKPQPVRPRGIPVGQRGIY